MIKAAFTKAALTNLLVIIFYATDNLATFDLENFSLA